MYSTVPSKASLLHNDMELECCFGRVAQRLESQKAERRDALVRRRAFALVSIYTRKLWQTLGLMYHNRQNH